MKKITGLRKAVHDYKELNKGGAYAPIYGLLIFDIETGNLWTDEHCDRGHNSYKSYESDAIVNLGRMMQDREIEINEANVKQFIAENF